MGMLDSVSIMNSKGYYTAVVIALELFLLQNGLPVIPNRFLKDGDQIHEHDTNHPVSAPSLHNFFLIKIGGDIFEDKPNFCFKSCQLFV